MDQDIKDINSTGNDRQRAVLIGIDFSDGDCERSLEELSRLADTAGADVLAIMSQKRDVPDVRTYLGRGKIDELKDFCKDNEIDLVISDDELSGSQVKALEDILEIQVIDRTMLILDIFASRAQSAEGSLQVELAQLKYRLPRLLGMGLSLSRQGGSGGGKSRIGTRGPGESKLETDRRHIRSRLVRLERELEGVALRRELTRKKRRKDNYPIVALVGYTNAGKSTLMNCLCDSDVYVQDKLFATLDPTVRRINIDGSEILMVDTVGFIRKLPHTLIEAFGSTLEETLEADLLLHVADISDPDVEKQIETVDKLMTKLEAIDIPRFLIMNKTDKAEKNPEQKNIAETVVNTQLRNSDELIKVSAVTGEGISELKQKIIEFFQKDKKRVILLIPYENGGLISFLHENGYVQAVSHEADGIMFDVILDKAEISRVEKFIK